jgi:uncharacterized Actinobacterial protein TIGR03083
VSTKEAVAGPTMSRLDVRFAVHRERLRLAALLDELAPAEWEQPSLCPDWRVRDVVAHLVLAPESTVGGMVVDLARARGDVDRVIRETARRKGTERTSTLVGELRAAADSDRRRPFTTHLEPLIDILVHGQDIVIPLRRVLAMPVNDAAVAASQVWQTRFFGARRRMRGIQLVARDVVWSRGQGLVVEGPIEPILLALTGRAARLDRLSGPGVDLLAQRFGGPAAA